MPIRLCLVDRCPRPAVRLGRCAVHARERDAATHPRKSLYNSRRWRYTRRKQLTNHPLCQHRWPDDGELRVREECGAIATDVDHITPIEDGGDAWSFDNLQSLCHMHHSMKTRREQQLPTEGAT